VNNWLIQVDRSWSLFLDRDGVINKRIFGGYITDFSEFEFSFVRSSGPGGQSVNTANSKVQLSWDINKNISISPDILQRFKERYPQFINEEGKVYLSSQIHRSQKMNMDDCIAKLYGLLKSVQFPPKMRKATKPKRSAVRARLDSKKLHSLKKRNRNYRE
jgi:ribosome-associated protein